MANKNYSARSLIGGGTGALDAISVGDIADGDACVIITLGNADWYYYNASSTKSESSPNYIIPDDNLSGTGAWELVTEPYDIGGTYNGNLTDGLVLLRYPMPRAVTFPAGLPGSKMIAATAATAQAVFSLKKNGTEFGTATFAAAGTSATFAAASETSFAAGDIFTIVAPAIADDTIADLGWAIVGSR